MLEWSDLVCECGAIPKDVAPSYFSRRGSMLLPIQQDTIIWTCANGHKQFTESVMDQDWNKRIRRKEL